MTRYDNLVCAYRKGETVYDKKTRSYYRIETIRCHRIQGQTRIFLKLHRAPGQLPEDSWREPSELSKSQTSKVIGGLLAD